MTKMARHLGASMKVHLADIRTGMRADTQSPL
jgi:hypothetical protein